MIQIQSKRAKVHNSSRKLAKKHSLNGYLKRLLRSSSGYIPKYIKVGGIQRPKLENNRKKTLYIVLHQK